MIPAYLGLADCYQISPRWCVVPTANGRFEPLAQEAFNNYVELLFEYYRLDFAETIHGEELEEYVPNRQPTILTTAIPRLDESQLVASGGTAFDNRNRDSDRLMAFVEETSSVLAEGTYPASIADEANLRRTA